jgi:putative transposase
MSLPRQILPGSTYLLSRRCTQRQFLLRPSALTTQIFTYVLAVAAERTGVLVHAACVLSNHWHAVVTDPDGRLPEFMAYTHKYVAKAVNASLGRWENLWATEQPSAVRLESKDDVVDKMLYTLLNPVDAVLVKHAEQWPGLWGYCGEVEVDRPGVFFRPEGPLPDKATLKFVPLSADWEGQSGPHFRQIFEGQLAEREQVLNVEHARIGKRYLGKWRVLRQNVYERPKSLEPRRNMSPRVACRHKWLRIEALRRVKEFIVAYRDAYRSWQRGAYDTLFPPGTYALCRYAGAQSATYS